MEVSQDRSNWTVVFDATRLLCRSWQIIKFPLQLVTFIRITGTGNTANDVFHLVHLECPATVLEAVDDTSAEEIGRGNLQQQPSSQSPRAQLIPAHILPTNSVGGGGTNGAVEGSGPPVYVDAVSALRHQRPRLLEVEEPSTPSSSLLAVLSTFSLHSEATMDATGTDATGGGQSLDAVPPQPPLPLSHHQRRRRRRYHHESAHQQSPLNEESFIASTANTVATAAGSFAGSNASATQYFSTNLRTISLSSVLRNDAEVNQQIGSLNDDSSLEFSEDAPSEHS